MRASAIPREDAKAVDVHPGGWGTWHAMQNRIRLLRRSSRGLGPGAKGRKDVLYPLDAVYAQAGIVPPRARVVSPDDNPTPYKSLLVHERDMTITLEAHFGGRVTLRALSTFRKGRY